MFDSAANSPDHESATRLRLLDAAGEIFSERGFREATVREICTRAGANVAAVNYHFGDKEGLYRATLKYADRCAATLREALPEGSATAGRPEDLLRLFIRAYIAAAFDTGRPVWHGRLIAREIMEPTPALDAIVEESIRPRSEFLAGALRALLGPAASDERVRLCKFSIIGQCLMYHCGRHVISRLHPEQGMDAGSIDQVVDHITSFTLAALAHMRRQAAGGEHAGEETPP